jgi:hypothetical protein
MGSSSTILMDASDITWRKTSAGRGVLLAVAFANSSALMFLDHSMYSMVKPLKWFSILLMRVKYLSRVDSLVIHSFLMYPMTTLESV